MTKIGVKYSPFTNTFGLEVDLELKDVKAGIKKASKALKKVNLYARTSETEKAIKSTKETLAGILESLINIYKIMEISLEANEGMCKTLGSVLESYSKALLILAHHKHSKKKR